MCHATERGTDLSARSLDSQYRCRFDYTTQLYLFTTDYRSGQAQRVRAARALSTTITAWQTDKATSFTDSHSPSHIRKSIEHHWLDTHSPSHIPLFAKRLPPSLLTHRTRGSPHTLSDRHAGCPSFVRLRASIAAPSEQQCHHDNLSTQGLHL